MTDTTERASAERHTTPCTRILPVNSALIGKVTFKHAEKNFLGEWSLEPSGSTDATNLQEAASRIRNTDTPVAFPTETVYGLGADATRGSAVSSIYRAKRRPGDNPLIVHVSSITQLRKLLRGGTETSGSIDELSDPIPPIYRVLIDQFWPGPLTILLPLPNPSPLAPQVTAGLPTVAVRMPSSLLALALIYLADVPIAAPSANTSTKPSPTTASHVLHDLSGRIDIILDGGPCDVGVESTVVDGLSSPPVILRPGGVSAESLRQCPGWEEVAIGYKDGPENGAPRAPGMKYKHYSPRAKVILVQRALDVQLLAKHSSSAANIGCVATRTWNAAIFKRICEQMRESNSPSTYSYPNYLQPGAERAADDSTGTLRNPSLARTTAKLTQVSIKRRLRSEPLRIWTVTLGTNIAQIARGLFAALRELDEIGVEVILVEGIDDREGGAAAAVMNRLRKAADQLES
ncbi:MAG: hypothetical protein HETSPECPRED_006973 [Heterodermia speciosa]|uniref:Threonylcarbamoyl-AMP synthase n=1 Tax=Heterodermia speciosa TaxID=116794 RepID=A0A8H3EGM9_9LECA|nr:MAG: hypothetical protein HETSPECPRED_006973 [Heterodermia speciosa]